jgi:hypothetical protein
MGMDATLIIGLVIASVLLLTLIVLLVRRTVVATVEAFFWQRRVALEQHVWVEETSYRGYPEGSRNQHSKRETYFTNEITSYTTTTTSNADGTPSTTTQPVYQMVPHWRTKYLYEIQRWRKSRELLAEGDKRTDVHWPPYTLDTERQERVEETHEHYQICFQTAKGKRYTCELPESEWTALDEQPAYRLRVTLLGKVTRFVPDPTQALLGDAGKAK